MTGWSWFWAGAVVVVAVVYVGYVLLDDRRRNRELLDYYERRR